jgi:hypothetical protein
MENNKKLSVALITWLTKTNNYRLSLARSLRLQLGFLDAINYLLALGKWLFWYRLWIRRDEFHVSLDLNIHLLWSDDLIRDYYTDDVVRRRQIAHTRKLALAP